MSETLLRCAFGISKDKFVSVINDEKIVVTKEENPGLYQNMAIFVCGLAEDYVEFAQLKKLALENKNKLPSLDTRPIIRGTVDAQEPKPQVNIEDESTLTEEHKALIRLYRDYFGFAPIKVKFWLERKDVLKTTFYRCFTTWGRFRDCALNPNILPDYKPEKPICDTTNMI